jgi:hypothetical protein
MLNVGSVVRPANCKQETMNPKSIILLVLALGLGLVASIGIKQAF